MRFVDTNVLLYAVSRGEAEKAKSTKALEVLTSKDLALSTQVIQEFYVQATRPSHPHPLTHDQAVALVESFRRYPILEVTMTVVESAFRCRERYQISYWDAAIVEAARAMDCRLLLSEDLQDGQDFAGVRVVNPFRDS